MSISLETNSILPGSDLFARNACERGRQFNVAKTGGTTIVEQEDNGTQTSTIASLRRELTPEEQRRVDYLKTLLVQTLTQIDGIPTDEQKSRIREIEEELEKITGVKMRSRLSDATTRMPGKDDEDEEQTKQEIQAQGIDPKEAEHLHIPDINKPLSPGMQMLRRNALQSTIQGLMDNAELLDTVTLGT